MKILRFWRVVKFNLDMARAEFHSYFARCEREMITRKRKKHREIKLRMVAKCWKRRGVEDQDFARLGSSENLISRFVLFRNERNKYWK